VVDVVASLIRISPAAGAGEPAAAQALAALQQIVDGLPQEVAVIDARGGLVYANRPCLLSLGLTAEQLPGAPAEPVFGADLLQPLGRAGDSGQPLMLEGWFCRPHLGRRYLRCSWSSLVLEGGAAAGPAHLLVLEDQTERQRRTTTAAEAPPDTPPELSQLEPGLEPLAYGDPLTGLPNRQSLIEQLRALVAEGEHFTLLNLDLDRFTNLRNSFGHGFADELLVGLVRTLQQTLKGRDLLGRIGRQAFALVLVGVVKPIEVERRVEALAAQLRTVQTRSGAAVFLSASIGIALAEGEGRRPEDILRDSEIASGRARDGGGNRAVRFDPAMHQRMVEQVRLEHDLRRALKGTDELWLAYQPIVEMVTTRLSGFEALCRWRHPRRLQVPPVEFVPIAEETGQIMALGQWVISEACHQLALWQERRGPGAMPLFMSVNLSPRQLEDPTFPLMVSRVLDETGIDPAHLKLELTEGAVMRRPEESIAMLDQLKALGVQLSIDDFGTGYSSLSYLHRFPIDSLKIDRSFVSALSHSEENRAIVRVILDLARLLGCDVIAEGIETEENWHMLRALACDYGQGYFFSRPLTAEAALPLVLGQQPWCLAS